MDSLNIREYQELKSARAAIEAAKQTIIANENIIKDLTSIKIKGFIFIAGFNEPRLTTGVIHPNVEFKFLDHKLIGVKLIGS